jgi:2,3-bisphosphoglycerate-independent phosphoglycerate mutase
MITTDHGNAEVMLQADGSTDTAHSTDQVPLIVVDEQVTLRQGAGLADLAPTLLCFLGLPAAAEMTGMPLC